MSAEYYTVCPHDCPDTCGLVTTVHNGWALEIRGDGRHPITAGWLCAKVDDYLAHVYHPDRLRYPLRRSGGKGAGRWERMTWDDAIAEIAERWREIIDEFGAEAIVPYSYSGTLGLVQMSVTSTRFWDRLGASRLIRSICGAAAEWATRATLGGRFSAPYEHVESSKLCIVWGHNPVSTAPHFLPALRRAQRAGCELVVIDPRYTRTARGADRHLAPLPGTDAALALGFGHVIAAEGMHDETWLAANTIGWPALRERLSAYPPQRVAAITGIPEESIIELAQRYASERPSVIKIGDGINRNRNGGQTVRAICTLPALTAQYGVRGGGLMYSTSDQVSWDWQALHRRESYYPPPGRKINMNRIGAALTGEASNPPVMSLYVFNANPAAISPNAGLIVKGLQREGLFTVVHELFMTDTADYADIVLPATSQLEHADIHTGYGHSYIAYNHAAIDPLGESKSNWEVMGLLAAALGFDEPWLHESADQVIDGILTETAKTQATLHGITLERLRRDSPLPINLPASVPFHDGRFATPSGKVELYSEWITTQGLDGLPTWQDNPDVVDPPPDGTPDDALLLVSAAAHHFVSSSFANHDQLCTREHGPFLEIHPDDAASREITDDMPVIVENARGWCRLPAKVTQAVRPGVVASPKGWWSRRSGGRNINWTTPDAVADLAGQSTFQTNRVWVRRVV